MINSRPTLPVTEFEKLPFAEQAAIIWRKGQPVATRYLPEFRIHLYAVGRQYIEMWVCRRRFVVTLFRIVSDTEDLLDYVSGDINTKITAGKSKWTANSFRQA